MSNPKNKLLGTTGDKILDEALKKLGVNPEDVRKDSTFDAKLMKMAVLGVLDSIKTFSDGAKTVLINTPGPINSSVLRVYLMAILSSADFALQILDEYDVKIHGRTLSADPLGGLSQNPYSRPKGKSSSPLSSVHLEDNKRSHDGTALDPFNEMDEQELENLSQEELEALDQALQDLEGPLDAPVNETPAQPKSENENKPEDILDKYLKGFTPVNRGKKGSN